MNVFGMILVLLIFNFNFIRLETKDLPGTKLKQQMSALHSILIDVYRRNDSGECPDGETYDEVNQVCMSLQDSGDTVFGLSGIGGGSPGNSGNSGGGK